MNVGDLVVCEPTSVEASIAVWLEAAQIYLRNGRPDAARQAMQEVRRLRNTTRSHSHAERSTVR